ncbi:transport, MFS family domain protein [Burkholderia mallei]|nr:transport, MFS family domain protein [Burkholderia mallei]
MQQRQRDAPEHHREARDQHAAAAERIGEPSRQRGCDDAHQIDDEDRADRRLPHRIRRREQPIADVVVERDEAAHQHERHREQHGQLALAAEMMGERRAVMREVQAAARHEMARRRQQHAEREHRREAEHADRAHRDAPREQVGENAGDHAPRHPADRGAADIEPHRESEPVRVHFFGEIRHRDGGHAAEREPRERAQDQQLMPVRRECGGEREQRRSGERSRHQPVAAQRFGDEAGDEHGGGERGRRERQRETALRGAHAECLREFRQQRLHVIEQRERRVTGEQQRDARVPVTA